MVSLTAADRIYFILIGHGPERLVLSESALTTTETIPAYYCLLSCPVLSRRHNHDEREIILIGAKENLV